MMQASRTSPCSFSSPDGDAALVMQALMISQVMNLLTGRLHRRGGGVGTEYVLASHLYEYATWAAKHASGLPFSPWEASILESSLGIGTLGIGSLEPPEPLDV